MLKLKELRAQKNMSVVRLAELSGIPRRTIEDIERRGDCRVSTARKLCDALQVPLDDFYDSKAGE